MNTNLLNLTDLYSSKHPEFNIEYNDEIYKKLKYLLELFICSNRDTAKIINPVMIKIYMENRLSLFSFHLWSLVLCSRTAIFWSIMSFYYDNRILKPRFCLVLQVWAFLFPTSIRSTNLNMKARKTEYVITQYTEKWQKVLLNQILMFCFHFFTEDLTPWSRFSRKNIIYNFNFQLFLFCFFSLNWSKANTINVIKPEKSGKEVIGVKITHKSGLNWWNPFLRQFRKCL